MSSKIKVDTIETVSGSGNVTVASGNALRVASGDLVVAGGNTSLTGNLSTSGASTLTGDLTVGGLTTLNGKFLIDGSNNDLMTFRATGDTQSQVLGLQFRNNSEAVTAQMFGTGDSSSNSVFRIKGIGNVDIVGGDIGVSAAAADLRVNTSGHVTTPQQPYFEACFSTSGWTDYAKGGTWVKMEMDATITNVGGHYDTTNTRFVAPVAGKYFMSASIFLNVSWNSSTPYLSYLGFYKNNAFFAHFGQDVQSTEHIRHGIIMPLAANDYVDVRIQQAQTPTTNQYYKQANARNYTYFHGMLIG